jgi:hypothetical protein
MPKGIGHGSTRKLKRAELVGGRGVTIQNRRAEKAGPKGAAKEAVRRVGEYKTGKVDKSLGTNEYINRRRQENLK